MIIDDYGVGSVICIQYASGSSNPIKMIGALEGVDFNGRAILRKQDLIHCEVDGKIYFLKNVTIDSADTAKTRVPSNSIISCEYISFDRLRRDRLISNVLDYNDELLKDLREEISKDKFVPRKLRFYTEDGFCIKKKER